LALAIFVLCFSEAAGQRANPAATVAGSQQEESAEASQNVQEQEQSDSADESEKPVKKKKFVPASSPGEALFLASREGTDTDAYLNQAKGMIGQSADGIKIADAKGRTPLHWAVIGAMYADKKLLASYCDLAELLIAGGADPSAQDAFGNTPLDYQQMSSAQEMLELLLEAEAHPGDGHNELAQLEALLRGVTGAADAGDIGKVRAMLAADLPLSTPLHIKLLTPVSSNKNRAGDPIEAVVSAPVTAGDRVVVAPGARIEGTILYAGKSANRFERSELVLDFANLVYENGPGARLVLRLTGIDNARETVSMNRIVGVSFPNNALNQKKITWGRRLAGMAFPAFGYAMEAATTVYGKKFNREIRYDAGTDMTLEVRIPAKVNAPAGLKGWPIYAPSAELVRLVNAQPQRVDTAKGEAVDVTNVMLLGSREKVDETFRAAGWADAASLGAKSGLMTFSAVVFKQGYDRAPFSDLYLAGRPADLTFQKQLNTFAKRHHIRVWKVGSYQGQEVWVGAATHDIGMGIDRKGAKPHWYHTVDTRVDGERANVMNDLLFTGRATGYSLVERPAMPKRNVTPAGNSRDTDGRMLLLALK
jgi:hypothetical protein